MRYVVAINDKSYEVEVEKGQANIIKANESEAQAVMHSVQAAAPVQQAVAAPVQQVPVQQSAAPAPREAQPAASTSGEQVKSPMPGTILDVRVTSGQAVKKGDILFILEAMKMENELMAPVDGTIQVVTTRGASVSTGEVLASIQ